MTKRKLALMVLVRDFFKAYFDLQHDKDDEATIIENIRSGVEFKGSNLLVLIFAIFVASLGLNVNSTAVIIGAMLISPLMGPIVGMGLAVGISDFALMKRSLKSFGVATLFSVATATIYFLFTPLDQAQSEILARTSPTIYDVFVALFGGLAGIVALCTKNKGNVIPGVAIATALMPPLCTAGFGLATGNWAYFLGAFYLYFINTVFISVATFIGVRMFRFSRKVQADKARELKVRRYIIGLVVVTMCPAVYLTMSIVRETFYTSSVNSFIAEELNFANTQVIDRKIDHGSRVISVVLVGEEVSQSKIAVARDQLRRYNLADSQLNIIQGAAGDSLDLSSLSSLVMKDFYANTERRVEEQRERIALLEQELSTYTKYVDFDRSIVDEVKVLFPQATSIAMAHTVKMAVDTLQEDTISLVVMRFKQHPKEVEKEKITDWLKARLGAKRLQLIVE